MFGGKVGYVSEQYVKKPNKSYGPTENLNIKTVDLINLGSDQDIEYSGQKISVKYFDNWKLIKDSVMDGLSDNPAITTEMKNSVNNMFTSTTFTWESHKDSDKNEFGKYLGELLYPCFYMKQNNCHCAFPKSNKFNCYDSFIVEPTKIIPISNKFGIGAPASFYRNILSKLDKDSLEPSHLRDMCGLSGTSYQMIQQYASMIFPGNPDLFSDIENGTISKTTEKTLNTIKEKVNNSTVNEGLPYSLSHGLNMLMKKNLHEDEISMQQINRVVKTNNFYQVKLNEIKWRDGTIDFKVKQNTDCVVRLCPSKSHSLDLRCQKGLITYKLC